RCHSLFKRKELKNEFEFKTQMIAALISITNNIAEGFEYGNNPDFIRFLRYSKGSTGESRNVLNVLKACDLVNEKVYADLYKGFSSLSKQISGLINYLLDYEKRKNKKDKPNL